MSNILTVTKRLADGRVIEATPLDGGAGMVGVFSDPRAEVYDDCFAYSLWLDALVALREWDGDGEPSGYLIHTQPKEHE